VRLICRRTAGECPSGKNGWLLPKDARLGNDTTLLYFELYDRVITDLDLRVMGGLEYRSQQ